MTEQHSTAVATLSCGTDLYCKNNFSSKVFLLGDNHLMPSKIAGLSLCKNKHVHENGTKNLICDDMVSGQFNHLVNDDVKAPQAAALKDVNKEYNEGDDFPHCVLQLYPLSILSKKDPIDVFVKVVEGTLKIGTPLYMPCRGFIYVGRIVAIKDGEHVFDCATKGDSVGIEVKCETGEQPRLRCRNAMARELLVSTASDVGGQQSSDIQSQ